MPPLRSKAEWSSPQPMRLNGLLPFRRAVDAPEDLRHRLVHSSGAVGLQHFGLPRPAHRWRAERLLPRGLARLHGLLLLLWWIGARTCSACWLASSWFRLEAKELLVRVCVQEVPVHPETLALPGRSTATEGRREAEAAAVRTCDTGPKRLDPVDTGSPRAILATRTLAQEFPDFPDLIL